MITRTELVIEPAKEDPYGSVPDIRFTPNESHAELIVITQGSDTIWLPRKDVAEFCRMLGEWAAVN